MATSVIKAEMYKSGDVLDVGRTTISGLITSGNRYIALTLFLSKPIAKNVTGATINEWNGTIRGILGTIDSTDTNTNLKDQYNVSCSAIQPNVVNMILQKTSAFANATNNTPVVCTSSFKITFN